MVTGLALVGVVMRPFLPLAIMLCAGLPTPRSLAAQAVVTAAAGPSIPVGGTADTYQTGYNVAIKAGMKPPFSALGMNIEGMFNQFKSSGSDSVVSRTLAVIANATISANPGTRFSIGYLIVGFGLYNTKSNVDRPGLTSGWNSDLGFSAGMGVSLPVKGIESFLEARFHLINSDAENVKFVPIAFGIRF